MQKELLDIIFAAGEKMVGFDRPRVYQKEGYANFVTQAGLEVQAFLMEELQKAAPGAAAL